jgi:hypothetical protein
MESQLEVGRCHRQLGARTVASSLFDYNQYSLYLRAFSVSRSAYCMEGVAQHPTLSDKILSRRVGTSIRQRHGSLPL